MSRVEVYRTKSLRRTERWRWRLISKNGHIVATSSEGYRHRQDCVNMALQVVNGFYAGATFQAP